MQITVPDDLAAAARLAELSEREAQRAWIIGAPRRTATLALQAARLAGLDRLGFQRHLVAASSDESPESSHGSATQAEKPWLALRGSGRFVGDPFAPVLSEEEIVVLQNDASGAGGKGS